MAIKISDTVVIDDSRNASNLASVSAASSITANTFYGDGSNLDGIVSNTTFLVPARAGNVTVLVSSSSFVVEGRSANTTIVL